jgi:hypothetical protein
LTSCDLPDCYILGCRKSSCNTAPKPRQAVCTISPFEMKKQNDVSPTPYSQHPVIHGSSSQSYHRTGCSHTAQVNTTTKSQSLDYPRLKSQVRGGGLQTPHGVTGPTAACRAASEDRRDRPMAASRAGREGSAATSAKGNRRRRPQG